MKLKRLAEWIKGKITKYKPGGLQIEQKEETETEAEWAIPIDTVAAALAKLGQAGYTIGEYPEEKQEKKEIQLTNNRRKMKGMPMVRRQQLRRAQRNRKRRSEE